MHQKVLKIENENAEGHLYVNHTVINLQAHRDKVTKRRKHYFFLGFAPPNTISRPGRSQTCCQRNFQINALRFSHSSWSRQVCVKNRYFYKIGRKKNSKKLNFISVWNFIDCHNAEFLLSMMIMSQNWVSWRLTN